MGVSERECVACAKVARASRRAGSASAAKCISRLAPIYHEINAAAWIGALPTFALTAMTLVVLTLVENSRIPVDDPTTHLELTMIHEVMVLDHSGPDLGYIHYAAALKFWIIGSLPVGLLVPVRSS